MSNASQVYGDVPPVAGTTDLFTNQLRATLQSTASLVQQVNRDNGWYDSERTVGDDVALLHSEVSEMFEAYRVGGLADHSHSVPHETEDGPTWHRTSILKPEGFGSECADVLIRLLDTCSRRGVDLAGETRRKLDYNKIRGYHHGGKRL